MSKRRAVDQNQITFHFHFSEEPEVKTLEGGSQERLSDFEFHMRATLKSCLEACSKRDNDPLDRYEVAARMSRLLGREITKTHIDQWVAMSAVQRRIQVDALKALCEVTGDWSPMHAFVESCGFRALHPEEAAAAEYGSKMLFKRMIDTDLKGILNGIDEDSLRRQLVGRIMGETS